MPLTDRDRRFLQTIERLKVYLILLACAILLYLLCSPSNEIQMVTSILAIALCGVFWLTQRLLSFITVLDVELTRVVNVLKRVVPEEQQKQLLR
jgi:hypothetical protein